MTTLSPRSTPAEEAAAEAMWALWGMGGNGPVARSWSAEGTVLRDLWRTYARAALTAAQSVATP